MATATTTKKKILDFFNPISNPAGALPVTQGMSAGVGAASALSAILSGKKPIVMPPMPAPGPMSMVPTTGAPAAPTAPVSRGTGAPVAPIPAPVPAASTAPAASGAPAAPKGVEIPKSWLNPDGSFKDPKMIAAELAKGGDVGRLAFGEFNGAGKTAEQLETEARDINNTRNDIAVGETDPYKVASKSGIAYTPEQLRAIEDAYAGVYNPALNSAFSRLNAKQLADKEASEAEAAAAKDTRDYENDIRKLAINHGYDLENMAKSHEYAVILQNMKKAADEESKGISDYSDEHSQRSVKSIDELMGQVNGWTTGWGSLLSHVPETDAKSFNTQLNTLKSSIAFNELTAMREASKTGGALGNVSNIELGLLESALAGLDSAQNPEDFKKQLTKAKESINRWRVAQGAAEVGLPPVQETVVEAPDKTQVIIVD